jgi:hypothetical protein
MACLQHIVIRGQFNFKIPRKCHFGKKPKGQDHNYVQIGKNLDIQRLNTTRWQSTLNEGLNIDEKWCTKYEKE